MAEENKLNQTPEITPAPAAEAPEKAPTTGELLGDVEHYDEEKDDWSTGYYGTGSRQQVTDDVFHKLETGEELTRDDFIKAELALQDAKLEAGIDLEKEKSPGLIGKYHDWKKNRVRHKVNKKKYLLLCLFLGWCGGHRYYEKRYALAAFYTLFFWSADSFTHIVGKNIDLKQVVNTNKCLIHLEKHGDKLLIISCIDNLLKGASGQAVHNMNLMFNLEETVGLRLKPSAF